MEIMVSIGGSHVLEAWASKTLENNNSCKAPLPKCFPEIGSKKAWKLLVKRVVFILSMISGTMAWSSTAPRIFEEALYITKMVEKVGLANIVHHFHDSKNFLKNSWKKWNKLTWPTFSTTQAVLEAQIVENVGQANFFHF